MTTNLDNPVDKDTKQFLLDVSFKVFMLKEYGQVTFRYLEDVVRYTRGVFFYYFDNKLSLFTQVIDKYFFSQLNPNYPVFNPTIKSFDAFLKLKVKHQAEIWEWFKQQKIDENPHKIMLHLLAQALMRYPEFESKYTAFTQMQYYDWQQAINIGIQGGEIRQDYDVEYLTAVLDSFFRTRPISTNNSITYNQIRQLCSNIGI